MATDFRISGFHSEERQKGKEGLPALYMLLTCRSFQALFVASLGEIGDEQTDGAGTHMEDLQPALAFLSLHILC